MAKPATKTKRTDVVIEDLREVLDGIYGLRITVHGEEVFNANRSDLWAGDIIKIVEALGHSASFVTLQREGK